MKQEVRTFSIDGMQVELTRVPVRRYDWDHREQREGEPWGHPKEQALYEIRIDGEHVGLASRPHGFGRQEFQIHRLGENFSTWRLGEVLVHGGRSCKNEHRLFDLDQVAMKSVELRKAKHFSNLRRLPTLGELRMFVAAEKREEARREAESKARREQWDREAAEQKRAAEEHRLEVLGGLQSIDERLGAQLSNYEANALRLAIARYAKS